MGYSFNGITKIISLTPGTTVLGVRDLYSRWKEWAQTADNAKFQGAFLSTGGDPIDEIAGLYVPAYIFLVNGWRIRPQEANHTLNVIDGIILVQGGGDPFLNTLGSYNVKINYQQPVQAITVATGGGGGGGLTQQQIRDAMTLQTTQPVAAGSIDAKIEGIIPFTQ